MQGEVWNTLKALRDKADVLLPYNIKNILQGKSLYKGKVAHISALVKSVESVSLKDTSIVLHDNTGMLLFAYLMIDPGPIRPKCYCGRLIFTVCPVSMETLNC